MFQRRSARRRWPVLLLAGVVTGLAVTEAGSASLPIRQTICNQPEVGFYQQSQQERLPASQPIGAWAGRVLASRSGVEQRAYVEASPDVAHVVKRDGSCFAGPAGDVMRVRESRRLQQLAAERAIAACNASPGWRGMAQDGETATGDNLRTVMRDGKDLSLREMDQPVALRLDKENYPDERVKIQVATGDGTCRLVVEHGSVTLNGVPLPAGMGTEILSGTEVVWHGEAGIRLENPANSRPPPRGSG
jgi:hypothetical protein